METRFDAGYVCLFVDVLDAEGKACDHFGHFDAFNDPALTQVESLGFQLES